jgi:hypothetical protein
MSVPVFGANMLRIDISSWWIVPFINMKWPSLSVVIDFSLKSTLSDMSVATLHCLWGPFAWKTFFYPLTLSQCLFFSVRQVSCKQHMVGSCFLTQFAILCLLIGAWRPFIFRGSCCFQSFLFSCWLVFTGQLAQKVLFSLESTCLILISSSICKSPLSIFCSVCLVVANYFSFSLL